MSDLRNFFKGNVKKAETVEFAPSERFVDEKGNVLKWQLKPLTNDEDDKLRNDCKIIAKGKNGITFEKLDSKKYTRAVIVNCVVYPNLNDKELQDSYGVMSAEELISEMLLTGEYMKLIDEINRISGFDTNLFEEAVEKAKN